MGHDLDARLLVGAVGDEGLGPGAGLDGHFEPGGDELGRGVGDESHPALVVGELLRDGHFHSHVTLRNRGRLLQTRRILNSLSPVTEPIVNDLTIQAATVNGSGSQTANLVLTRAIFHMGIPVAPKNVFPSNIEGLPTWYQLRITPEGHMARSDKVDILIAFNVATWREDLKTVRAGGVVIHEEAFSKADARTDLIYYPVPFSKLAKAKIQSDTLRKQLANMIYVGVVAGLLGIQWESVEHAVKRQFLAKPKAVPVNLDAIKVGYDYWQDNFSKQDPYRLEPMTGRVEGKVLVEGNQAAALGALMGGATVVAWYPITPSSSLCEYFIAYSDRFRLDPETGEKLVSVVQAEDELAAVGMAIGAGWAGARSFTSTSGPGISLMAEFSGLAYAGRHRLCVHAVARRHQTPGAPPRHGGGVLRVRARRVRSRGPLPDAGVRAVRPRPGHEPVDDARVQVPRQEVRPGQGPVEGRPREGRR
ncbi:MAG: hypothetical protein E6I50_09785 [Chloroflexi bacterium]|nr:MAG: hypothetical protein E6I50_09785 [Chloroflexota bacterium]